MKPTIEEIPEFYQGYLRSTTEEDLINQMVATRDDLVGLIEGLSDEQALHRYAEGKWSIKELVVHMMDSERVFAYRALCFARNEKTPLPGFEQDDYVNSSDADERDMASLVDEYVCLRNSTIRFFKNLTQNQLMNSGTASGFEFTANAMGYLLVGHQNHHVKIIKERYLG